MSVAKDRTRIDHDLAWGKRSPWERSFWSGTGVACGALNPSATCNANATAQAIWGGLWRKKADSGCRFIWSDTKANPGNRHPARRLAPCPKSSSNPASPSARAASVACGVTGKNPSSGHEGNRDPEKVSESTAMRPHTVPLCLVQAPALDQAPIAFALNRSSAPIRTRTLQRSSRRIPRNPGRFPTHFWPFARESRLRLNPSQSSTWVECLNPNQQGRFVPSCSAFSSSRLPR
jgi:hypothetical protein